MSELKKAIGYISISHSVTCPHCGETMYEKIDHESWDNNVTDQLPNDEIYKYGTEATCSECGEEFMIEHFEV